ncbi:NAD(P)-dependent oxidoreductase [Granulicella arctica]|uniref:NAD(P)-dependent oxidoreductase n=1 Tax=Granulicella arctica TaxID=940613 RepID=UPI0021E0CCA1|nr:NAD(P)-dependent oxidoreductase [Granulicella arctica]
MATKSVALLGLGTMGSGMAANLLKAGFPLTIYNRTKSKAEPFAAQGATVADTPAQAAAEAEIIIAMLADDAASRDAWLGENGALAAAQPGAILIDASTVSPAWIAELDQAATTRGLSLLDAPVTGSRPQAEAAQLTFLVGGSAEALAKATPVLQSMSKEIIHLGPSGSGVKIKLVNNFLCGVQVASLAEGLAWLERSGLDVEKALTILKAGAPGSPLLGGISARMTSRDYTVNFVMKLMAKDLQYAHDAAAALGVDLTTATNAHTLFEAAMANGYADKDMSSVVEPLRNKN